MLSSLSLWDNSLTGYIPMELCNLANLIFLYLDQNKLIGQIPSSLGQLTILSQLHLYQNSLTGSLPKELGNISNLEVLQLDQNKLVGEIPTMLGRLTMLIELALWDNSWTGDIPTKLGNLDNLEFCISIKAKTLAKDHLRLVSSQSYQSCISSKILSQDHCPLNLGS